MKKLLLFPVLAGVGVLSLSSTYAFPGFGSQDEEGQGEKMHHRQAFGQVGQRGFGEQEAFHTAIEAGDYEAFLASAPEHLLEVIDSPEAFEQLQAMHTAKKAGDDETAKALAETLGLPPRGMQKGPGMHMFSPEIQQALENGDYLAFVEAADERLLTQIDTEDKFVLFVELYEAKQLGDDERAKDIAAELGLQPPHQNKGQGKRAFFRKSLRLDEVDTYDAFQEQYGTTKMATKMTSEVFALVKNLIEAYDMGDKDTMQAVVQQVKNLVQ